jgi:type II secretory pathway pseudopilin PulG
MTWRERRIVTILSSILLILLAALLVVLGMRYKARRAAEEDESTAAFAEITDPDNYTTLTYDNGSATLSFSRDGDGDWIWDGDAGFPLDDATLTSILDIVTNWAPQQILTDSDSLENSGVDEPTASLTAATAQGTETTLLFGKTTTDGDSWYVQRNGDAQTVYIISDTLYLLMQTPIYNMCRLPELPNLNTVEVRYVTIYGPDTTDEEGNTVSGPVTTLTAQQTDSSADVSWRCDGANVSYDPTVTELMQDLYSLSFSRCVDYRPSDEAVTICGFDAPAARVEINYADDSGAVQTLTLTIGNRLPDGSGRYTRMDGDEPISLLTTDLLDPLMRVAANGLEN